MTKRNYRIICENYTSLVKECGNVMAYSAAGKNEEAYKTANGSIAKYTKNIEKAISSMREHVNSVTQGEKEPRKYLSRICCHMYIYYCSKYNCITVCCFCCCHHGYQASAPYTEGNQRHHSQY